MNNYLKNFGSILTFLFLIFVPSCSKDCSQCEKELALCMSSEPMSVDLPEPDEHIIESNNSILAVEINASDLYNMNGEEYSFEDLIPIIEQELNSTETQDRKLKVNIDKNAHFESVYKLITFSEEKNIKLLLNQIEN